MALVDEIRSRRPDPDDPFDQDQARGEFSAAAKKRGRTDAARMADAYRDGVKEGRTRRAPSSPTAKRAVAKTRAATRRRRPGPARVAARQVMAPVRSQVASGTHVLGLTLLVVALYLVLESAPAAAGFLGGINKALEWLRSPTGVVPTK